MTARALGVGAPTAGGGAAARANDTRDWHSSAYRADIDGLRAIAVIPVVLFHAGLPLMSGGYVGVDVFFVISGFLITGIIAGEMAQGRFSLAEFYRRRARRIFPALTLVGLFTLAVGYLILTPKEFAGLGQSAAAVAVFGSNFHFWKNVSYFSPGIQPLLHTWSLAVEEQYYLFFPLLLLLHGQQRLMAAALWVVFALSMACSALLVWKAPGAAFYLLPSRAWELMLGGLLALGCFGFPHDAVGAKAASALGLALIAIPVVAYRAAMPFPGPTALPPVLGAALLIWGRGHGLAWAPLVWVGRRSYSLYLWHLPVIAFTRYLTDAPLSVVGGLATALVSLALAHVTFMVVETPFRAPQVKALWPAAGMVLLGAAALVVSALHGMPSRLSAAQRRQIAVMDDETRHPSRCMTLDSQWVDPARPCVFGTSPGVLLWGDSHAMVTATSLAAAGVPFLFAADADCPIGEGLSIDASREPGLAAQGSYRRCGDYNAGMLRRALAADVRTVVLSARWTNWRIGEPANPAEDPVDLRLVDRAGAAASVMDNRAKFERGFAALVRDLTRAGKRVVIVGPLPEPTFNVPHRLYVAAFGLTPAPTTAHYADRHKVIRDYLRQFRHWPGVSLVWPASLLCRPACATVQDGVPVYFDHNHLTVAAAQRLAPLYASLK